MGQNCPRSLPPSRCARTVTRMALKSLLLFVVLGFAAPARAQTTPDISHDPLDCTGVDKYPVIDAAIQPGKEIRTAKVYFRADHYPKFYWVEMVIHEDNFVSILPKPSPGTTRIIYYIEAMDVTFNHAVDVEHDPESSREMQGPPRSLFARRRTGHHRRGHGSWSISTSSRLRDRGNHRDYCHDGCCHLRNRWWSRHRHGRCHRRGRCRRRWACRRRDGTLGPKNPGSRRAAGSATASSTTRSATATSSTTRSATTSSTTTSATTSANHHLRHHHP